MGICGSSLGFQDIVCIVLRPTVWVAMLKTIPVMVWQHEETVFGAEELLETHLRAASLCIVGLAKLQSFDLIPSCLVSQVLLKAPNILCSLQPEVSQPEPRNPSSGHTLG